MDPYAGAIYSQAPRLPASLATSPAPSVANACQAGGAALLDPAIRPQESGSRIVGRAVTCECSPGDNLALHRALRLCQKGDIIVAGTHSDDVAVWGGLMSTAAKARGAAGAVIDGYVRDSERIRQLAFPVWSRGVRARGPGHQCLITVNAPVQCGGQTVFAGDLVFADDDGVAVLPRAEVTSAWQRIREREQREDELERRVLEGESLFALLGLAAEVGRAGFVEIEGSWEPQSQRERNGREYR